MVANNLIRPHVVAQLSTENELQRMILIDFRSFSIFSTTSLKTRGKLTDDCRKLYRSNIATIQLCISTYFVLKRIYIIIYYTLRISVGTVVSKPMVIIILWLSDISTIIL